MTDNRSIRRGVVTRSLKVPHAVAVIAAAVLSVLLGSSAAFVRLVTQALASMRRTSPVPRARSF